MEENKILKGSDIFQEGEWNEFFGDANILRKFISKIRKDLLCVRSFNLKGNSKNIKAGKWLHRYNYKELDNNDYIRVLPEMEDKLGICQLLSFLISTNDIELNDLIEFKKIN